MLNAEERDKFLIRANKVLDDYTEGLMSLDEVKDSLVRILIDCDTERINALINVLLSAS